jgi:membrane protein
MAQPERTDATSGAAPPARPTDLSKRSWRDVLKRTVSEFRQDDLTLLAAALTYYAVLSLFPALLVLVSILGLLGASATQPLVDNLATLAPGPARDIVTNAIHNLQSASDTAGFAFVIGLAIALWSASGYVGGFIKASNVIYEVEEGRPFWKLRPFQIAVTVLLVLISAALALAIVITGPLAKRVGDVIGLGDTAVTVWNVAKWPAIALVVSQVIAFLYWVAPNIRHPGYRWISPGGVLAVVLWVIASVAFAFYVANFGSYNKTYGSLAAVMIFLIWLWITNVAILLGAEFNAELERGRAIEAGMRPEDKEPFAEPRDTRKMERQESA